MHKWLSFDAASGTVFTGARDASRLMPVYDSDGGGR